MTRLTLILAGFAALSTAEAAAPVYRAQHGAPALPVAQPASPPALAMVAANVPPAEPLLPFGDAQDWIVLSPLVYTIGDTKDTITVPAGFVTDLASTPQMLWSAGLTPAGQYSRAAIIHDYLYWSQNCTRDQADRLLLIAMKESNVGRIEEGLIYAAVHVAGDKAWSNNAKERTAGLPRILPLDRRRPADANTIWSVYRSDLYKLGVKDDPDPPNGAYCHWGDSTKVPGPVAASP